MNLLHHLQQQFHAALSGLVADPTPYVAMVKPAQDARFGDYQANCAMSLAKALSQKPRDVATEIVKRLDLGTSLEPPEIAGPGFINLRFRTAWLAKQLQQIAADDRLGIAPAPSPRTIVIDYSSPNVAKPMHVGHLRSTIIGDSLTRLFRFLGHKVVTDNHLGDWGLQFGMLIHGYRHFRDEAALLADPVQEMVRLYKVVRKLIDPAEKVEDKKAPAEDFDPEVLTRSMEALATCRRETAKLHAGDADNVQLWQTFMPWCLAELERVYQRLGILKFDRTLGESFYNPMLAGVVRELKEKGIAQDSKGAVAIFFGEKESPAIVQSAHGAFTYTTSDLATIRYRMEQWQPDTVLYVVDFRQKLHFKNLFNAACRLGYDRVDLQHISFGSVLGPDGKPLKTREGDAADLDFLLTAAVHRALEVYRSSTAETRERGDEIADLPTEQEREIAEVVGLGAVKYADLSQNRESDYEFSLDKMLAMEGNTATYMQYAYVRNRGIFRKGGESFERFRTQPPQPNLEHANERALALQLLRFEEALEATAADYRPNLITGYLWDLAKAYSGFFEKCPVLKAETPALRQSRLLLCDLTGRVIQQGLQLLGIRTVEQM